jgi:hypothetical protein
LGFGRELSEFIEVDAFGEEDGVKRDATIWASTVGPAMGFIEELG